MAKVIENKFIFNDGLSLVYCYNCKTEMSFNGHSYECPVCGSIYRGGVFDMR